MNSESFREYCSNFPGVTEDLKWENDLCFLIGGKMFAVLVLEPANVVCSFKCTEEDYLNTLENEGVISAPYLGRYFWIALESFGAVEDKELKRLVSNSYQMVFNKLPKRIKKEIST